ncbi:MAG: hypothetical protein CSB33_02180 [Desulfobacterales bacterium]|nr:MAG: hypothetical protein CSB33_02180 [Desulfobacterales bacterium]
MVRIRLCIFPAPVNRRDRIFPCMGDAPDHANGMAVSDAWIVRSRSGERKYAGGNRFLSMGGIWIIF